MKEIYLDNAATTPPHSSVLIKMSEMEKDFYGNPSALHILGMEAEKLLKKARNDVATLLNAQSKQIIFTSGGTESNNTVLFSCFKTHIKKNVSRGRRLIISAFEHPSISSMADELSDYGIDVVKIGFSDGEFDVDLLKNSINDKTDLVAIMHVNNEIGLELPIEKIGALISTAKNDKGKKIWFHVDAVQSFGKIDIDVQKNFKNVDSASFSAHKIHGPKGVGGLYVRIPSQLSPYIVGGGQEGTLRSGTENVEGIVGLSAAALIAQKDMEENYKKIRELYFAYVKKFSQTIKGLHFNLLFSEKDMDSGEYIDITTRFNGKKFSPYVLSIAFLGVKGEVMLHMLENMGIYVSTGSACSSHKNSISETLSSIGLNNEQAEGTIRFSFGTNNNIDEVETVVKAVNECVNNIRKTTKKIRS